MVFSYSGNIFIPTIPFDTIILCNRKSSYQYNPYFTDEETGSGQEVAAAGLKQASPTPRHTAFPLHCSASQGEGWVTKSPRVLTVQ